MLQMLRKGKYESAEQEGKLTEKAFLSRMTVSVLLMLTLMIGMGVTAFAYFSCDVTSGTSVLQAGKYDLSVKVTADDQEAPVEDYAATLTAGKTYTVTLEYVPGSASTGFAMVKLGGVTIITDQIGTNAAAPEQKLERLTLTIAVTGSGTADMKVIPHWGTSSYYAMPAEVEGVFYVRDGAELTVSIGTEQTTPEEPTEPAEPSEPTEPTNPTEPTDPTDPTEPAGEEVYIVQSGDNLYAIAEKYGTTYEILQAYNELEDPRKIYEGQEIKIPPDDYVIPEESQPSTEATEPSTEATEPSTEATEPSTEATEPSTEATEPSTEATQPATEATEPSTEATEPSTEATEPSTEATEPSTEATEPSTEATQPSTEATEPSTEATDGQPE